MRVLTHLFALSLLSSLLIAGVNRTSSVKAINGAKHSAPLIPVIASHISSASLPVQSACPVTIPNGKSPTGEQPGTLFHGVNGLWTILYEEGKIVCGPAGPGSIETDGSLGIKFPWWRGVRGNLTIEGRRLDGAAPPLRAGIPDGYGDIGFQASGIFFPTEGCWEVTGKVSDVSLTFVTRVIKAKPVMSASAASFSGAALAPESIASAFGIDLAATVEAANTIPLPTTLAGTRVFVNLRDGKGDLAAPLFYVSPMQINYQIPPGTPTGRAYITAVSGGDRYSMGTAEIVAVAPGLFSANADGQGVPAGVALRVRGDNSQTIEALARFDAKQNRFVAVPLDLGPEGDQVFLILFGTGIRFRSNLAAVTATIGGTDAQVLFAGAQGELVGTDQINLRAPRSLIGRGDVEIALTVDGRAANALHVNIQ